MNWRMGMDGRSEFGAPYEDVTGDSLGMQLRVGYPPRRAHLRAAAAAAAPAATPAGRTREPAADRDRALRTRARSKWDGRRRSPATPAIPTAIR